MRHDTQWHAAAPLWSSSLADSGLSPRRFKQPALLRFSSESFMDELTEVLEQNPEKLPDYAAQPETWKAESAGWLAESALPAEAVKLYQPVHNRFYLVAASLVCRVPGLPDRRVDRAVEERTSFVVRRIDAASAVPIDPTDENTWVESAWIGDRQDGAWELVTERTSVAEGEERHKLFSVGFELDGQKRRLQAGMVPVAGREVYEARAAVGESIETDELGDDPLADPRVAEFHDRVVVALEELAESGEDLTDDSAREAFLFVLLDLGELLERDHPAVWDSLGGNTNGLSQEESDLLDDLDNDVVPGTSWSALLLDANTHREAVLLGELGLPPQLAGLELGAAQIDAAAGSLLAEGLETDYEAALAELPPPPAAEEIAADSEPEPAETLYVIRLVYERPRCGAAVVPEVSLPTFPFQLASFFDPDAPVRPVRIRMPVDTSVKGLRRFPKAASFLVSEQLRKQFEKLEGLSVSDVEDGSLNEPSGTINFGVIWVMSIPIITICALILLMIIVQLLNIVFWWLPFFKIAIPIKLGGSE